MKFIKPNCDIESVLNMSVEELRDAMDRLQATTLYVEKVKATRATNGRYINAARGKKLGGGFRYGSKAEVKRVRNVLYLNGGK
jgi:hypothetical protein